MLTAIFAQAEPATAEQLTRDSAILGEQFYFFTVVLMWLIHAGFMSYEAGVARRKNVMATAMKNILTIAVVTPTFYYFGWMIYNCAQPGIPISPGSSDFTAAACGTGIAWADAFGPNLTNNINLIFFLAFLLFSWTSASIMSGAIIERARLSAYLVLAVMLGSVVWILDAAWGWSAGGWLTLRFGFHDSIASGVVHGVAGAFTLGVLFNVGPRIGKYTKEGLARQFRPHNLHITALGLMLIFTGFYAFYGACLVIASTSFPGWANIYLSPATLGSITMVITMGFAGGFTGGYFASKGDPFWTISGGLAGVIGVSAGADVYAPTLAYLISMLTAVLAVFAGNWIETKARVDDAVGAVAVHGVCGFLGVLWVGIFAAGYPTGINNVESSIGGQLMGIATSCRWASCPAGGRRGSSSSSTCCGCRSRSSSTGLDIVEYGTLAYPEIARDPRAGDRARRDADRDRDGAARSPPTTGGRRRSRRRSRDAEPHRRRRHHARRRRRVRAVGRARAAPARHPGGGPCPRSSIARPTASSTSAARSPPTTPPTSSCRRPTRSARAS